MIAYGPQLLHLQERHTLSPALAELGAGPAYVEELQQAGIAISMAEVGQAWQNGYAERLIRTIKEEEVQLALTSKMRSATINLTREAIMKEQKVLKRLSLEDVSSKVTAQPTRNRKKSWKKPELKDVTKEIMAQPFIRFT